MSKGSSRRPGKGYADGYERIWGGEKCGKCVHFDWCSGASGGLGLRVEPRDKHELPCKYSPSWYQVETC